jgi:hypothetical protein
MKRNRLVRSLAAAVAIATVAAIAIVLVAPGEARVQSTSVTYLTSASWSVYGNRDSQSFTVPDGPLAKALIFVFAGKRGADAITTPTYAGRPLSRLASRGQGTTRLEIWYLLAPPGGTAAFAWTKSGANENVTWGLSLFAGVDQSDPFGPVAQAGATQDGGGAKTVDPLELSAGTGGLTFDAAVFNGGTVSSGPSANASQTTLWSRKMSTTQGGTAIAPGTQGVVSISWTPQGSPQFDWSILGFAIHPLADGDGIPVATTPPTVTQKGDTFTVASNGVWTNDPTEFTYQWESCGIPPGGSSCSPIPGATDSTYAAPIDSYPVNVRLAVTARNGVGSGVAESDTLSFSGSYVVLAQPVVSGAPRVGSTLTTTPGSIADPNAGVVLGGGVGWARCAANGFSCHVIDGASRQTYTLVAADVGFTIRSIENIFYGGIDPPPPVTLASLPTAVVQP